MLSLARENPAPIHATAAEIDRCALWALGMELRLYPKAGLVSFVDTGSHVDMNAATFLRSTAALKGYFAALAQAGAEGASFAGMKAIGIAAEARMFRATGGVNTHRGAVFSLGLLAAAAGMDDEMDISAYPLERSRRLCARVRRWGADILAARSPVDASHGAQVRARYGAAGAREQAAAGFPVLRAHTLPAFHAARRAGAGIEAAGLHAFYATVAVLDDNNMLYRAGPEGLAYARRAAGEFMAAGGMLVPEGFGRARALHAAFVARRLSPGGAADLVAAAFFLAALSGLVPERALPWR
ncbi:triphosphoribosyl-dephospho-CoA synthase [Starkeya koreensis]|uniref:triphosphoribosyl-dephospho-CoA synthase n=1 Tax=Ancylobacter koreensis TaxID=266121 RepID=A0ABT0DKG6_9HYPH|nr:triphosphoribosyl-dephospho-CoA synthase [Ancylobacter koreensis]MCK0207755.1 triphosphoribosyl-dephospho-CoA synthase [Ancylobacter koreensis]